MHRLILIWILCTISIKRSVLGSSTTLHGNSPLLFSILHSPSCSTCNVRIYCFGGCPGCPAWFLRWRRGSLERGGCSSSSSSSSAAAVCLCARSCGVVAGDGYGGMAVAVVTAYNPAAALHAAGDGRMALTTDLLPPLQTPRRLLSSPSRQTHCAPRLPLARRRRLVQGRRPVLPRLLQFHSRLTDSHIGCSTFVESRHKEALLEPIETLNNSAGL